MTRDQWREAYREARKVARFQRAFIDRLPRRESISLLAAIPSQLVKATFRYGDPLQWPAFRYGRPRCYRSRLTGRAIPSRRPKPALIGKSILWVIVDEHHPTVGKMAPPL